MILRLEVASASGREPSAASEKTFRAAGGTIGRSPGNDLVLPDPYVSSRHARVIYSNGVFQLEDTSTNGVFVNSPDNRLAHGKPCVLKTGDVILIDPYRDPRVHLGRAWPRGAATDWRRPVRPTRTAASRPRPSVVFVDPGTAGRRRCRSTKLAQPRPGPAETGGAPGRGSPAQFTALGTLPATRCGSTRAADARGRLRDSRRLRPAQVGRGAAPGARAASDGALAAGDAAALG